MAHRYGREQRQKKIQDFAQSTTADLAELRKKRAQTADPKGKKVTVPYEQSDDEEDGSAKFASVVRETKPEKPTTTPIPEPKSAKTKEITKIELTNAMTSLENNRQK
jgi:hypothetical protein